MKLIDLICACKEIQFETIGSLDVEIFGITSNTKKIAEGYLFVALRGAKFDGHDFITEAIEKDDLIKKDDVILINNFIEKIKNELKLK